MTSDTNGGVADPVDDDGLADRARRLFLYLRELADLRSRNVRDVADYEQVVWLAGFPAGTPARSILELGDDGESLSAWLEVDRTLLPELSDPPGDLFRWLDQSALRDHDLDEPPFIELDDSTVLPDDVLDSYVEYVDRIWEPWALATRERMPAYEFYRSLFTMSERRQRLGEVYELVVGLGLVTWQRRNQRIHRHLITTPAEISVDAETGRISVVPSASEGRNRLELDMLEPDDQGDPEGVQAIRTEVEATDPLALLASADDLLNKWANRAHPSGQYVDSLERIVPGEQLRVVKAPALVLRRRGQRTTRDLLDAIAHRISEGTVELPEGVERLVSTSGGVFDGERPLQFSDPEVYFPLPSNEEQRQVIDRMQTGRGVLVQGPPGTGKSLTIANLIAHLLAQGKRVLVTSHTERALRVLHEKLPDEIKPLCISLLGNDGDSIRDLESAVELISSRQADWSALDAERNVESLRSKLEDVRSKLAAAQNQLRQIGESSAKSISIGRYRGTSQAVARELSAERETLGWIPDGVATSEPPIGNDDFAELLTLVWDLPDGSQAAAEASLPDPGELVASARLEELFIVEAETAASLSRSRDRFGSLVEGLERLDTESLDIAESSLRSIAEIATPLLANRGWTSVAVAEILGDHPGAWQAREQASAEYLTSASELPDEIGDAEVTGLGDRSLVEAIAATQALLDHATAGGRLKPGILAAKPVKSNRWVLEVVRLDGSPPTSAIQLRQLRDRLELAQCVEHLATLWNHLVDLTDEPLRLQIARFGDASADLQRALSLTDFKRDAIASLSVMPRAVPQDWTDVETITQLVEAVNGVRSYRQVESVHAEIALARKAIGDDSHSSPQLLRDAIDSRDIDAYRAALVELKRIVLMSEGFHRQNDLRSRLSADAPLLADQLPRIRSDEWIRWAARFESAWAWSEAHGRLASLVDPGAPQRLNGQVNSLSESERGLLAEISAGLAWIRMFEVLGNEQSQALAAWAVAIKRVGKGKGKYADRHRRTARQYMDQARGAIPAWIMPMYRVAENVDSLPELFDVVIVDEASQSSVESLFLFYLGRQVIVVGDDQQIAPEAVGIDQASVHRLQEQYLKGLPFSALFSPESSLFDQAKVRFEGRIVLREHFRCMPEIIEFSNQIAYRQESLLPLRQYGTDRLEPIRTVYLEHGHREGRRSAINRPEAEEIVARIEKMCTDPRYDEMTFGVISLQGGHQSNLIEQMLLDRIGPQEMLARQIVCGDAYAFQGDERDVILLSMVAAPNARIGSLAKQSDTRRFNVAASRAKDQVWLVHSVTPDDLSASDMRRRLLEYYLEPKVSQLGEIGEFDPNVLNAPFESRFEQDVYRMILEKGYRVVPQFPVAGYRIDLVVEGMQGRIAVECDGDKWHGLERHDADTSRQRQLERSGWVFFRVGGSEFYADPEAGLDPLWALLDRHGIYPGANSSTPTMSTRVDPLTGSGNPTLLSNLGESVRADIGTALHDELPAVEASTEDDHSGHRTRPDAVSPSANPSSDTARAPTNDHPLGLKVRDRLQHPRKGAATVEQLLFPEVADGPVVAIRFDGGGQFEYTRDEYRRAGFARETEKPTSVSETKPSAFSSTQDAQHRRTTPDRTRLRTSSAEKTTGVQLSGHRAWNPTAVPDPRRTDSGDLARYMKLIIEAEGPITTDRVYKLIVKAAGFSRVTQPVRRRLDKALLRMQEIEVRENPNPHTSWPQRVARIVGTPEVAVRELGSRDFYEVPLDEIAQLMIYLATDHPRWLNAELKRRALVTYGGRKLTKKADQYLDAALDLSRIP